MHRIEKSKWCSPPPRTVTKHPYPTFPATPRISPPAPPKLPIISPTYARFLSYRSPKLRLRLRNSALPIIVNSNTDPRTSGISAPQNAKKHPERCLIVRISQTNCMKLIQEFFGSPTWTRTRDLRINSRTQCINQNTAKQIRTIKSMRNGRFSIPVCSGIRWIFIC